MKKQNAAFSRSFVSAVKQGIVPQPVSTKDVKRYAAEVNAHVSESYLNSFLANSSSLTYSLNYPKYFEKDNQGTYNLSALGWKEG